MRANKLVLIGVAGALAASTHGAETDGIDFGTINDPLAETPAFLPVDQAFVFSSRLRVGEDGVEEIVARWDMPVGYYLYRHGFRADAEKGLSLGEPQMPPGEMRTDEYFSESEVYVGSVEVVVPVRKRTVQRASVRFAYQGCAERGLCYPPSERQAMFQFESVRPAHWHGGVLVAAAGLLVVVLLAVRAMRSRRAVP